MEADRVEGAETWVIAATNRDLHERVNKGLFREDLLYRLDVMRVDLPPLRLRGSDVEMLAWRSQPATHGHRRRRPLERPW